MKGWQIGLIIGGGLGLAAALTSSGPGPNDGGGEGEGEGDPNEGGGGGSSTTAKPKNIGVPFAGGGDDPLWPLIQSKHGRRFEVPFVDVDGKWHGNRSRAFGVSRPWPDGDRHHAGIDLYANGEDIVVAPEDGVVVGRQGGYPGQTGAILLELDSGIVVLLGEVKMGGAAEFGLKLGSRVKRGDPVTRVWWQDSKPETPGIQGGAHMLHFEAYEPGTTQNSKWPKSSSAPSGLLDPTEYLLRARAAAQNIA